MTSPSREDYLEMIYLLVQEKGSARVTDLAAALGLQPSSVTRMVQKLGEEHLVRYERYRDLGLTPRGEALGRALAERHLLLAEFLRALGIDEGTVQRDVEGIEHHVSRATLERISAFVAFLRARPELMATFQTATMDPE